MSKRILITMPDGFIWQVPIEFVAATKASSVFDEDALKKVIEDETLTDIEKIKKIEATTNAAYDKEMSDEDAVVAWGRDNLEWKDVVRYATVFSAPDTSDTYTAGWKSGEMKIIEVDDELEKQAMNGVL